MRKVEKGKREAGRMAERTKEAGSIARDAGREVGRMVRWRGGQRKSEKGRR